MAYRAFVSSTFVDLKDHRAHVISSLQRAGFAIDPMEYWTADGDEPKKFSQDRLNGCDLCVLLVAFRRGYVPDGETLSITQLEYEAALKQGIDVLPFMLEEKAPWPRDFDELDKDPGIKGWREELRKRHGVEPFNLEPRSIDMTGALGRWLAKRPVQPPPVESQDVPKKITWDISKDKDGSPYPGLMHFTRKYSRVFFGRDDEIREILYRMQKPEGRFVIVSGGSGTGKSSLVDAGILPKLEQTGLPGVGTCLCVRVVPSQGDHPFDALTRVLHSQVEQVGFKAYDLGKELLAQPAIFTERIHTIVSKGMNNKAFVLFLDQMEELFTPQAKDHAKPFLSALWSGANEGSLRVIATIRSDFLHHCHEHPEMVKVLNGRGHHALGPVEQFMMHDMIVKPAKCAGLTISENLARRIVNDTGAEPGNLPLLAFVLDQLFEKRSDHELSEDVYKTLGGVGGAITEHVKTVEEKMRQALGGKAPELLPKIFQSLVIVNPDGLPTRNRPLLSGFSEAQCPVVKLLTDGRLLHTEGEGKASTVSISHEKLFEAWPSLRDYISVNKKSLIDQTLLENRARKWEEMGKPRFNGLASGQELKDFRRGGKPTRLAKDYLQASRRAVWFRNGTGVILATIFVIILAAWQQGLSVGHTILKLRSKVMPIHIEPEMVEIKPVSFRMGNIVRALSLLEDDQPVHPVAIQKPFRLGRYEVTFEEYDRFALATGRRRPSDWGWGRERQPVIDVSWEDAVEYAQWLSRQTGKHYRLPSEAEWEYTARAGTETNYWWGNDLIKGMANCNSCGTEWDQKQTAPVGSFKPNSLGLYDTAGNVWEWVEDCYHKDYKGAPSDGTAWESKDPKQCGRRVVRGGSWSTNPDSIRASLRLSYNSANRGNTVGFRLAQDLK